MQMSKGNSGTVAFMSLARFSKELTLFHEGTYFRLPLEGSRQSFLSSAVENSMSKA